MVYTRSQKVEALSAARIIVSLNSSRAKTLQTLQSIRGSVVVTMDESHRTVREPKEAQLWSNWTMWYHTFVSEVQDEAMSSKGGNRFVEAERRWATFCAKKLRCDLTSVQAWLKFSDVKQRLSLAGF